jgi:hypothetical protein
MSQDYCGVFTEDAVRKNFVLVYELLDEILDDGYAVCTSTDALKPFIYNDAVAPSSASSALPAWAQVSINRLCITILLHHHHHPAHHE